MPMADSVENFLYKCSIAVLGCDFGWHGHLGRDCRGDSRIARFVIPAEECHPRENGGGKSWKRSTSFQLVNKIASRSVSAFNPKSKIGNRKSPPIHAFEDTWHWHQAAAKAYHEIVEAGGRVSLQRI